MGASAIFFGVLLSSSVSTTSSHRNVSGRESPSSSEGAASATYTPDFFALSRPDNALDMALQLPGFSISVEAPTRGLGEQRGNVLIDGARSARKDDPSSELRRIPAAQVLRLELIRGGAPGIDMAGYSTVLNVVRKPGSSASSSVNASGFHGTKGGSGATLEFEHGSGGRDRRRSATANLVREDRRSSGSLERSAPGPNATERQAAINDKRALTADAGLSAEAPLFPEAKLSGRLAFNRRNFEIAEARNGIGGTPELRAVTLQRLWSAEGSAKLQFEPGARTNATLTFLHSRTNGGTESVAKVADNEIRFGNDSHREEWAGSLVSQWKLGQSWMGEAGIDYAFNSLEATASFVTDGLLVPIPGSDSIVSEKRLGGYGALNWSDNDFSGQLRLRIDRILLRAQGAGNAVSSTLELRPRAQLAWAPSPRTKLDFSMAREIDQLQFEQFAASAALADGTVTAGNAALTATRRWTSTADVQQSIWAKGAVTFTLRAEAIDNPIDIVPTVQGLEALGNVGSAWSFGLRTQATLPLDALGLAGAKLNIDQTLNHSEVTDPVTRETRELSGTSPWRWNIGLRQDLVSLPISWGLNVSGSEPTVSYRVAEITSFNMGPTFGAFLEYKPRSNFSVRGSLNMLGDIVSERRIFDGPRDRHAVARTERQSLSQEAFATLSLRLSG